MNHQKKINTIKARLLLGETINDQEMLSYAINALNESDINYKWFLKALKKPLSKQSNILLLELYRVTLINSNFEIAKRLTKILLNKTSQSFVIDTLMNCKNFKLRNALIKFVEQNTKFKGLNGVYFFYRLYLARKISRKVFVGEIDLKIKQITKEKNTSPYRALGWERLEVDKQYLLKIMNLSVLMAKIGLAKKGEGLFIKALYEMQKYPSSSFKELFDSSINGYRYRANEKRFTDGICNFDEITKFLDTDYKAYFKNPYNRHELEVATLRSTKPLIFAQEFSKYALSNQIMQMMMDIHVSQKFRHKDIFGVTELIERVMNENYYWCVKNAFIEHFFKKQHYSSKIAYLIFPKLTEQHAGVDIARLKNTFANKCLRDGIKPAHYEWENRFIYSEMSFNTFAFKYLYQLTQDKNIKNWLEDLCVASMLVSYDGALDRNFETKTLKKLSQIFVNADKFYKIIEKKINDLADPGIGNVNYLSIDNAIEILRNARVSNSETAKKSAHHFIQNVRFHPSTKYLLAYGKTRNEITASTKANDFFANKKFRDELNKFMAFVFRDNAYKYNVSRYEILVCVYCNRKVYSLYKQANPFVVLDAKYSPAPPSIVNKVRLKKINNEFSNRSKDELLQLLNMETKNFNGGSYKRVIFLMDKLFEISSSFKPKRFLENSLFRDMHVTVKLRVLYHLRSTSYSGHGGIKTTKSFRDELENFYNELCTEISHIDINSFKKHKDEIVNLIQYLQIKGLPETFFKKFPSEIFDFTWDKYCRYYNDTGMVQPDYSEKAISQALEHKINQANEMNCISDNDVNFISSILDFYNESFFHSYFDFRKYSINCHNIILKSAPNIQRQLFIRAESLFEGKNLTNTEEFNSFKNILTILLRICQKYNKKHLGKLIQTNFYNSFLMFLQENETYIINNDNYRALVLKLSSEVNDAKEHATLDISLKNKFFKYFDDLVIKIIHENKIPLDKFRELGIENSKYEIIGWSLFLEKGNPVNEDQETKLNRMPLTQEMYSLCKKFNAPYWATQLNLFEAI